MSVVSGVISRQVLPACGRLCVFCPGLRTRSRQPVKRYKNLISDIFPRNQDEEPNDRKIGKLCEYASKNPLRIPKIADSLEQKCYKELRNENFRSVKIIVCIFRKLIVSCKEQLPLFANSVLAIMHTLLEQANKDEMLTMGCGLLFDFVNNQNDGSYVFNLEGFIPKLCQLAREEEDDEREECMKAAGLQSLSALVWFMGENSHISADFDTIVSVVLENYEGANKDSTEPNVNRWLQEVHKTEGHVSPSPGFATKVPSWDIVVNDKGQLNVSPEVAKNPCFWSRVCLQNMARLGYEATTMRRVLESLFRYFDNGNLWTAKNGIAFPVLKEMQLLIDDSGANTHLLLSILVKHLDHKNVVKEIEMQLDIVEVITGLAKLTKVQSSVAIVSAVSDVMRHLRKCMHNLHDDANVGADFVKWNRTFRDVMDECLIELSSKVGDASMILDVMATMLENIPSVAIVARTTISVVYRTAQIIASLPNLSYQKKAFPESLFHQLLPAMLHPDHETRIGAHQIFSVVLVPSSVSPQADPTMFDPNRKMDFPRTLSRTVSVFSSSAALFEKLKDQKNKSKESHTDEVANNRIGVMNRVYSRVYSLRSLPEQDSVSVAKDPVPLRLSSHQISILLSSLWVQSNSPTNKPEDYVAIAHTYSLVLLFSRAKNSYRETLVRCFQLAFSLRNISLSSGGRLPPSRRRSLFVMSTCMIIFSSKAYDILHLIPHVKATLSNKVVDPYLCLVDDSKLQLNENISVRQISYGSEEDDSLAHRCLLDLHLSNDQTRESLTSFIINRLDNLSESEESATREQLLTEFIPDELCSIKGQSFHNGPGRGSDKSLTKTASLLTVDDESLTDSLASSRQGSQISVEFNFLSVDQLLQSVLDTAQHNVGRMSVSTATDVSYKETARHCETLMGRKQKVSNLLKNTTQKKQQFSLMAIPSHISAQENITDDGLQKGLVNGATCSVEAQQYPNSLGLPASCQYDNFLKAA